MLSELHPETRPKTTLTTAPVEWVRVVDAVRIFSISRSKLYELIKEGRIKSCSIRRKGATRGARRISAESLSTYLHSLAD